MEGLSAQVKADMNMFVDQFNNTNELADEKKSKKEKAPPAPKVSFAPAETLVPPEDDSEAKASVMRKINAYEREFPEQLGEVKTTKQFAAKATLEEMKMKLADIEHELGKGAAFSFVTTGYQQACATIERIQASNPILPWNITNLGEASKLASSVYQLPDGSIHKGHMIAPLKELSIKYSDWFSQRVEVRIILGTIQMMQEVHRINTEGPKVAKAAQEKKAPPKAAAAAKNL